MDYKILSLYIVLGTLVMIGYAGLYKINSEQLWTNKGTNRVTKNSLLRSIYKCMILLSFLSGLYIVYYVSSREIFDEISNKLVYIGSLLFLSFSIIWSMRPFFYSRYILLVVAIGAILLLAGIVSDNDHDQTLNHDLAIVASCILVIQTFVFDFFLWNRIL
jgi:hypothetical protein